VAKSRHLQDIHKERTAQYRVRAGREATKAQMDSWQQDAMAAGTAHLFQALMMHQSTFM
jgi:hypothetical protein